MIFVSTSLDVKITSNTRITCINVVMESKLIRANSLQKQTLKRN